MKIEQLNLLKGGGGKKMGLNMRLSTLRCIQRLSKDFQTMEVKKNENTSWSCQQKVHVCPYFST